MVKLFANNGDPDQMLHFVASDLGLHCLPNTHLWVSSLQLVNEVPSTCFSWRGRRNNKALQDNSRHKIRDICHRKKKMTFHVNFLHIYLHEMSSPCSSKY